MGETSKAQLRRWEEGWYEKYIKAPGLDVGSGLDPLDAEGFLCWDNFWLDVGDRVVSQVNDHDAVSLAGLDDQSFNTVYASHVLEHLKDHSTALKNWWRVLRDGGHLIVCVPHRDLYEKKKTLPSQWNDDHVSLWLPETDELPDTLSLKRVILEAIPNANIISLKVLDAGYDHSLATEIHPVGEYTIEAIVGKYL